MKPANNSGQPDAEWAEPRAGAKGNVGQQHTRRAQETGQACHRRWTAYGEGCRRERKKERFTAASFHHVDVPMLRTAFHGLRRDAAPGADGLTWQDYEADLDRRIEDLHDRVHRGRTGRNSIAAMSSFLSLDGRQRPPGDCRAGGQDCPARGRYGAERRSTRRTSSDCRMDSGPRRSQHDALDALVTGIGNTKVNWVAGRRHPKLLRYGQPGMAGEVRGAPGRRPPASSA